MKHSEHFEKAAKSAGLTGPDIDQYLSGIQGGQESKMELSRPVYTALQKATEEAIMEIIWSTSSELQPKGPSIVYRTPRPLTPLYREHPRQEIAISLFFRERALSVMSEQELNAQIDAAQITLQERQKISKIMSARSADYNPPQDIFSISPGEFPWSYMATHLQVSDQEYNIAFDARQLTFPNARRQSGNVIFGQEALDMYRNVQEHHQSNLAAGRGTHYINQLLN